jgi:capsular exopolysaccharide synthesis family protein
MNDSPLAAYFEPLRRWWWVVVGLVALALVATWLTLPEQRGQTEAEIASDATSFRATHLVIRNEAATTQLSFGLVELLARQGELINRVTDRIGDGIEPADVEAVFLETDEDTQTMSITAVRPRPAEAVQLATVYAEELVSFLEERSRNSVENDYQRVTERLEELEASIGIVESEIAALPEGSVARRLPEAEISSLLEEYSLLRTQQRSLVEQREGLVDGFVTLEAPSPVPMLDEADLLSVPEQPALRFALAAVIAALFGGAVVLVLDHNDTRIRTRRQTEDAFGLPVIAELPRRSRRHGRRHPLPAFHDPGGVTSEVLRSLRLSIALAPTWHLSSLSRNGTGAVGSKTPVKLDDEPRSVVITSTLTGDGKSTLAANLAVSVAEGGRRVLVVDCDFRRPAVGRLLEVDPGLGLRELSQVNERPLHDLASPTVAPNVAMVRSGSRGVTPPWFMREAKDLVERCLEMADYVIFDTGPITLTNEASALLPHVDTALMVVRSGKVATDQARGAVEQLTQVDAHVSGVVLMGSNSRRRYGYGYYREAGSDPTALEAEATTPTSPPGPERGVPSLWQTNRRPDDPETPEDLDPGGETLADPSPFGTKPNGTKPSGMRASGRRASS